MAKILFIDDRPGEIIQQWNDSGLAESHVLLPLEKFESLDQAQRQVEAFEPDVIVIGHGLSHPELNGADVIRHLLQKGYTGIVIGNSGGGKDAFQKSNLNIHSHASRDGHKLRLAIKNSVNKGGDNE